SLELMPIFERHGLLRRRPRTDLVDQPLQIRKFLPGAIAEHGGNKSCPSPDVHINDRVGVAQHVFLLAKARVENASMSAGLKRITVDSVGGSFRAHSFGNALIARNKGLHLTTRRTSMTKVPRVLCRSWRAGICRSSPRDKVG